MKFAFVFAITIAAALAAGCATPAPGSARLAQEDCAILYRPILHENVYGEHTFGRRSPTSGTDQYCRHVQEENARYANRERIQRQTNADYPMPSPRT